MSLLSCCHIFRFAQRVTQLTREIQREMCIRFGMPVVHPQHQKTQKHHHKQHHKLDHTLARKYDAPMPNRKVHLTMCHAKVFFWSLCGNGNVSLYVFMFVCLCVCLCSFVGLCFYVCVFVCVLLCFCVCVFVFLFVCLCFCVNIALFTPPNLYRSAARFSPNLHTNKLVWNTVGLVSPSFSWTLLTICYFRGQVALWLNRSWCLKPLVRGWVWDPLAGDNVPMWPFYARPDCD